VTVRIGVDATHVLPEGKGHALSQRKAAEGLAALGYDVVAFVRPQGKGLLALETYVLRSPKTVLWELAELPLAKRRLGLDVVLTFSERLPLAGGPYVVWLFELPAHRLAANRGGASRYQRSSDVLTAALWRRGLARASRIVAGSEATRRELVAELPAVEPRTRVVYPALRDGFGPGPGRPGRYVFHLSSADPRDNTAVVIEAAARVGVPLVVGGGLGAREAELRARAGPEVTFTGRLSEDELLAAYRGASAYVDASLYEGFGYQVLEALACGAPVVASRETSVPEVVGDAGLLADPRSADEIEAALRRVLDDPALAARLRERGLERASAFSWERTARGLADAVEASL